MTEETVTDPKTGQTTTRKVMDVDKLVERDRRVDAGPRAGRQGVRRDRAGRGAGRVPARAATSRASKFDEHGHISLSQVNLAKHPARSWSRTSTSSRPGRSAQVTGLQLGYEARCALPHAFDVMLGSQLGVGAYRALVENGLDGVMVSVSGQLNLNYVPFEKLVDPETLVTVVRYIQPGSDFQRLARFLENYPHD